MGLLFSNVSQLPFMLLMKLRCLVVKGGLVPRLSLRQSILMAPVPLLELQHHLLLDLLPQASHLLLVPLRSLGYLLIHQMLVLRDR